MEADGHASVLLSTDPRVHAQESVIVHEHLTPHLKGARLPDGQREAAGTRASQGLFFFPT